MSDRADTTARGPAGGARWILPASVVLVLGSLAGWAVVYLPPWLALGLLAAALAITLWLQDPALSLYGLAAICPFELSYQVGGLNDVRVHDALIVTLAISAVTAVLAGSRRRLRFKLPMAKVLLVLWCFLLVWGTITFLLGPANRWLLRDATHNAWYVYRDIGRSMIVFPLVLLCLDNRRVVTRVLDIMEISGAGVALDAIWLARGSDSTAQGPFGHPNALAGYMVLIIPFAAARCLMDDRKLMRAGHVVALLLMLRALWLTGSRGGLVAFLASLLVLALLVPRRRAVAAAAAGFAALALVLALRGDILNLPMMHRFIALTDVKDVQTFQWRQEQWSLFLQRVRERPWLGTGSDVDESMRDLDRARTAHNAFLALAVKSGLPAACVWAAVLLLALGLSLRRVLVALTVQEKSFWTGTAGFLVALVIDNLVESNLVTIVTQHCFWIVVACALLMTCGESTLVGEPATEVGVTTARS